MTSEQIGQPLTERPKLLVEDIARKMADLDREVKYLIGKAKSFKPKVIKSDKNKTEETKTKSNDTGERFVLTSFGKKIFDIPYNYMSISMVIVNLHLLKVIIDLYVNN